MNRKTNTRPVAAKPVAGAGPRPARPSARRPGQRPRIALALAGGGPLGAIYEIGALCALEQSLTGLDFSKLDHYVGVSAGGFIAAGLANGMSPRALCSAFIENDNSQSGIFDPSLLMVPAYDEFARRAIMLPGLLASALWRIAGRRKSLTQVLEGLGAALPAGVFSNRQVHEQLARLFTGSGFTNDFRQLNTRLTLVATNLDTGEAAPFGRPGWDHVPISRAVQASSALPGLFPPVEIEDRYYVDGALKKSMHASVALDQGVDLLFCLNPLVPFDATTPLVSRVMQRAGRSEHRKIPSIVDGGLPAVLSQTFRSMIHSRMELGMKQYERIYPHTDIVLLEPDRRDPVIYLANTFGYAQRRDLAEHAFQQTRQMLRSRTTGLSATLARHGVFLDHQALDDPQASLCAPASTTGRLGRAIASLQEVMDDLGHLAGRPALAG